MMGKKIFYLLAIGIVGFLGYFVFIHDDYETDTQTETVQASQKVLRTPSLPPAITNPIGTIRGEEVSKEAENFTYTETQLLSMQTSRNPFDMQEEVTKLSIDLKREYERVKLEQEVKEEEEPPAQPEAEEPNSTEIEEPVEEVIEKPTEETLSGIVTIEELTPLITPIALKHNIEPTWLLAVIKKEGKFDTNQVNENIEDNGKLESVDRGLMQINSKTAPWLATKLGLKYSEGMEFNTETNLEMGAFYLSYLKNISPELDFIFTAYNRGPSGANTYKANNGTYETPYSKDIKALLSS